DPQSKVYVVFLSNRVHPDGKGDVTPLRARVATVAAAALLGTTDLQASASAFARPAPERAAARPAAPTHAPTLTGIDVLAAEGFARLKGKRIGLVTNQTGRSRTSASTIDLFAGAKDLKLVALFSPEHGIRGQLDQENVPSTRDEKTGLTIHSLYGATRRPTDSMLDGLDTLVVDL